MLTKDGMKVYWKGEEVIAIKVKNMFYANEYQGKKEVAIGKKVFVHFLEQPKDGRISYECTGSRNGCEFCKAGNKASVKFILDVIHDGNDRIAEFGVTVAREIAKTQENLKKIGKSDAEIMNVDYTITHFQGKPYWQVEWALGTGAAAAAPEMAIGPIEETVVGAATPAAAMPAGVRLNVEEVTYLKKLENSIKSNLERNPAWDYKAAIKDYLKKMKWSGDKQDTALTFFAKDGSFVEQAAMVEA